MSTIPKSDNVLFGSKTIYFCFNLSSPLSVKPYLFTLTLTYSPGVTAPFLLLSIKGGAYTSNAVKYIVPCLPLTDITEPASDNSIQSDNKLLSVIVLNFISPEYINVLGTAICIGFPLESCPFIIVESTVSATIITEPLPIVVW